MLITAPALGLQGVDQARRNVLLDRLARDVAIALGLDRTLAQFGREPAGAGDEFVGAGDAIRRGR